MSVQAKSYDTTVKLPERGGPEFAAFLVLLLLASQFQYE